MSRPITPNGILYSGTGVQAAPTGRAHPETGGRAQWVTVVASLAGVGQFAQLRYWIGCGYGSPSPSWGVVDTVGTAGLYDLASNDNEVALRIELGASDFFAVEVVANAGGNQLDVIAFVDR